jgi:hypothetical protein
MVMQRIAQTSKVTPVITQALLLLVNGGSQAGISTNRIEGAK